jgi:hypothetical protein
MAEPETTEMLEVGERTSPPLTPATFTEQRLQSLMEARREDLEHVTRVCPSRDPEQCLRYVLEPNSVVLVGGGNRWLPTQDQKPAILLRAFGHRVLFVPIKENVPATGTASKRIPISSPYVHP